MLKTASVLTVAGLAAAASGQIIITGVIDGGLSGGLPKAVELYVTQDIADLSGYSLLGYNNGSSSNNGGSTVFSGSAAAGTFLYVSTDAAAFASYFGFEANFIGGGPNFNGDDAIALTLNGVAVDVFGEIGVDATGLAWEYTDGWAYRVDGAGPSTTFNIADWTFSALDVTDGTTNVGQTGFPFGTYVVPAPGALALAGFGALAAARRRR